METWEKQSSQNEAGENLRGNSKNLYGSFLSACFCKLFQAGSRGLSLHSLQYYSLQNSFMISWVWHRFTLLKTGSFPLASAAQVLALRFASSHMADWLREPFGCRLIIRGDFSYFSARSVPWLSSLHGCTNTGAGVRKWGTSKGPGMGRKTERSSRLPFSVLAYARLSWCQTKAKIMFSKGCWTLIAVENVGNWNV